VFIAKETDRPLGPLPDHVAVSVVTIGELQLGVLAAIDENVLARRADTLALARESDPIPVSEPVMTAWARLVVDCRRMGVHHTVRLTDRSCAAMACSRPTRLRGGEDLFGVVAWDDRDAGLIDEDDAHVGARLLERTSRTVTLTEAGSVLLSRPARRSRARTHRHRTGPGRSARDAHARSGHLRLHGPAACTARTPSKPSSSSSCSVPSTGRDSDSRVPRQHPRHPSAWLPNSSTTS